MKRRTIAALLCLIGTVAGGLWWWRDRSPHWNIVLITLDTTRADHLGCYGRSAAMTPNIDRLAAEGMLFERAYTVVPITLPAHATLLTGKLPPEHGLRINGVSRLADAVPALAEILNERGYQTGAFVSSLVLDRRFGLARGFDRYSDSMPEGPSGPSPERPAFGTVSAAISWLKRLKPDPFFCWVHLYDPHEPYEEHRDEFGDQFAGRAYDAEIAYMDRQIGRLLKSLSELGADHRTLILVVGDHGEGLGDHGENTHGYLAYNSTMHVPLIIRYPDGGDAATRIANPVSLVDIFPTILDGLNLPSPESSTGRSLLAFRNGSSPEPRPCYGETEAPMMEGGWSPLRTWTTDRWKLIQSTKPELYDLHADRGEVNNLFPEHPDEVARLSQQLAALESQLVVNQGSSAILSEQEQRALASLGYTGGQVADDQHGDTPRRDIKDTLQYAEQVHHCMHLIDHNELGEAQEILKGVVEALPDYSKAWGTLGVSFAKQNDFPAAEHHFQRAVQLDANQNFARIGLGRALFELQRFEEAADELRIAVMIEPSAVDAQFYLGEACRHLQHWEESRTAYEAALELAPDLMEARTGLAELRRRSEENAASRPTVE